MAPERIFAGALLATALLLHGCQGTGRGKSKPPVRQPTVVVEELPEWQRSASDEDVQRLGRLQQAWAEALEVARKAGFRRNVAVEGLLLDPEAALARPAPGPGSYMCRSIQIGPATRRAPALSVSSPNFCYLGVDENNRLWLAKQTGPGRRQGFLWDDGAAPRMIFLGASASGSKDPPPSYGNDPDRNRGAVLERIGPLRYRLVTPWPPGYKLEVLELVPAPVQRDE